MHGVENNLFAGRSFVDAGSANVDRDRPPPSAKALEDVEKENTVAAPSCLVSKGPLVPETAQWKRKPFQASKDGELIWCKGNGRDRISQFIDEAKHTLFVQNERYQDAVIIERLVRAHERGVKIHVMARPPHKLKKEKLTEGVGGLRILDDVGVKVHKLKHLKLHAKMLLADHSRAIVGSINLTPGSFDSRRELAIEVYASNVVERLDRIAHHDWKHSNPLDLTDKGLLAELSKHNVDAAEELALHASPSKSKKR